MIGLKFFSRAVNCFILDGTTSLRGEEVFDFPVRRVDSKRAMERGNFSLSKHGFRSSYV